MEIKFKRLKENAKMPKYQHHGDVGMDLYATETVTIPPSGHHCFWHGFALEFPDGYGAFVKDKSSIAKAGLHHLAGIFDAGYRGEYNTLLVNLSDKPYTFEEGDKVSQLVIMPVAIVNLKEVDILSDSARGEGMFGSTGKK